MSKKKLSFREWCKQIVYRNTDKWGETITTITYKDGSEKRLYNDGSYEEVPSKLSLEELKDMFETETGNSW